MISRCSLAVKSDEKHSSYICKNTGNPCRFIPPSSRACEALYGGGDGLTNEQRALLLGDSDEKPKKEVKKRGRRKRNE